MQEQEIFPTKVIDSKEAGPKGLVIAGVHGDEYEPVFAVQRLIRELEGKLVSGSVALIPVVNTSAFFSSSRAGEDGLDLARTCPGDESGTRTERVAAAISEKIRNSDFLIDMHTGGNLFAIAPLAGYMLHPSRHVLSAQREMAVAFNLSIIWGTHAGLDGRTLSVARDAGIPSIYTETGGGGSKDPRFVEMLFQGCLNVLAHFGMLEEKKREPKVQYIVEDNTAESGHLQVMYPSPVTGIFQPVVKLNETVKKGQTIGLLCDLDGTTLSHITAEQAGLLFLLREVPSVKKGDALAGILPIERPGKVEIE